jgi:hypothetical protein
MCAIHRSLQSIIKQRDSLLSATLDTEGDDYRGCYVILMQALVEGGVLTQQSAAVLGSETCMSFARMPFAQRKAACGLYSGNSTGRGNADDQGDSSSSSTPRPQKSAGAVLVPGRFGLASMLLLVAVACFF